MLFVFKGIDCCSRCLVDGERRVVGEKKPVLYFADVKNKTRSEATGSCTSLPFSEQFLPPSTMLFLVFQVASDVIGVMGRAVTS